MSHYVRQIVIRLNRATGQPRCAVVTNRGTWYGRDITWSLCRKLHLTAATKQLTGEVNVIPALYGRRGHESIGWIASRNGTKHEESNS